MVLQWKHTEGSSWKTTGYPIPFLHSARIFRLHVCLFKSLELTHYCRGTVSAFLKFCRAHNCTINAFFIKNLAFFFCDFMTKSCRDSKQQSAESESYEHQTWGLRPGNGSMVKLYASSSFYWASVANALIYCSHIGLLYYP